MLSKAQEQLLERFIAGLKFDGYDDYHLSPQPPHRDSDWHVQGWHGRFLMLGGTVELDIFGQKFSIAEGESYEVLTDVKHREVFGDKDAILVIGRRKNGRPLPALTPPKVPISLR